MELIFIDDRLDLGQFGDLMDQRRGVVAEQSLTTSSAVGRLAGDGLADFLGRDQDPLGLDDAWADRRVSCRWEERAAFAWPR